jgi:hypothetical protein
MLNILTISALLRLILAAIPYLRAWGKEDPEKVAREIDDIASTLKAAKRNDKELTEDEKKEIASKAARDFARQLRKL